MVGQWLSRHERTNYHDDMFLFSDCMLRHYCMLILFMTLLDIRDIRLIIVSIYDNLSYFCIWLRERIFLKFFIVEWVDFNWVAFIMHYCFRESSASLQRVILLEQGVTSRPFLLWVTSKWISVPTLTVGWQAWFIWLCQGWHINN